MQRRRMPSGIADGTRRVEWGERRGGRAEANSDRRRDEEERRSRRRKENEEGTRAMAEEREKVVMMLNLHQRGGRDNGRGSLGVFFLPPARCARMLLAAARRRARRGRRSDTSDAPLASLPAWSTSGLASTSGGEWDRLTSSSWRLLALLRQTAGADDLREHTTLPPSSSSPLHRAQSPPPPIRTSVAFSLSSMSSSESPVHTSPGRSPRACAAATPTARPLSRDVRRRASARRHRPCTPHHSPVPRPSARTFLASTPWTGAGAQS